MWMTTAKTEGPVEVLHRCLEEVMWWEMANKLKLSPDKNKLLLVSVEAAGGPKRTAVPLNDQVCSFGCYWIPY